MKYQTKPIPVEAVQFAKDKPWPPNVFKHSWNVGPSNYEELPTVKTKTVEEVEDMFGKNTWLKDGEWIVTYPTGVVEVVPDRVFQVLFEERT